MTQHRLMATALAAALVVGLPGPVRSQAAETIDAGSDPPYGIDWTLTRYADPESGQLEDVPLGIAPTLRLQDGRAWGFAGCDRFEGSYESDATSLRLGDELTVTLATCDDDEGAIEEAYLAALRTVDGWILDGDRLELSDGLGDIVLAFEVADVGWTGAQLADLVTTLDEVTARLEAAETTIGEMREQMDGGTIGKLRQRIRTLERENEKLRQRLDSLEGEPRAGSGDTGGRAFSRAERVLLEGIPARIAGTCSPLRSGLPDGTRAAVRCTPNTSVVARVDYHLLEGDAAAAAFGDAMAAFDVPDAVSGSDTCAQGVKSQRYWVGRGWQAEGCYRSNRRAELRFVDNATDCRRLKVGDRTLRSPAFYIALQGADGNLARVHDWATRNLDASASQLTSLTTPIERPDARLSPTCPT